MIYLTDIISISRSVYRHQHLQPNRLNIHGAAVCSIHPRQTILSRVIKRYQEIRRDKWVHFSVNHLVSVSGYLSVNRSIHSIHSASVITWLFFLPLPAHTCSSVFGHLLSLPAGVSHHQSLQGPRGLHQAVRHPSEHLTRTWFIVLSIYLFYTFYFILIQWHFRLSDSL